MEYEELQKILSKATLGGRPGVGALLGGAALGGLGYWKGPEIAERLLGIMPGGQLSPYGERRRRSARRRMGALGTLAGMAPFLPFLYGNIKRKGLSGAWRPYKEASLKSADLLDYPGSLSTIRHDPFLPPGPKAQAEDILDQGMLRASHGGKLRGLLTSGDLIRGAVGAGLGWGTASVAGRVMGDLLALPAGARDKISRSGLLAGALIGSGIIGRR